MGIAFHWLQLRGKSTSRRSDLLPMDEHLYPEESMAFTENLGENIFIFRMITTENLGEHLHLSYDHRTGDPLG
ncbi:hypothetical protein N7533_011229 [Penicillium manginii]|uniref:uncharacterized protein n=1 Tax=Penicillium manginii TaxID=203109 RepID=UPI002548EACB|nr:uncharacterized protein N7533_011229 [Penicillium manginii]KAJ5741820.1 hypothetical protein N7533_011229 [Penicillium manginii]